MRGKSVRTSILVAVLTSTALVVGLLVWYFVSQRSASAVLAHGERTNVLILGTEQNQDIVRSSVVTVLSTSADGQFVFLSVPEELTVKRGDGSFVELGTVYGLGGADEAREAVGGLLGIEVPFYVVMDDSDVVALIAETGDLLVTVEERTVYLDPSTDPATQIDIRPGEQMLDGAGVLAYLRGESEEGRIARQQRVARALVEQGFVRRAPAAVRRAVGALHPALDTNLSLSDLCRVAAALGEADLDRLEIATVPGEDVIVGGTVRLQPQIVETERIVASLIKTLDLLTPNEVSVAVFNGNGIRLMARRTADYLRERGFRITRIANAEVFDYSVSYVVVLTDEEKAWILRDALASPVKTVFPDAFDPHYEALKDYVPIGTDLLLIAGAGMELE
jgi:anionic cell wall polymer biosynthesis LytR-Cps2A-Psr (LCP) family protein